MEHWNTIYNDQENHRAVAECCCGHEVTIGYAAGSNSARRIAMDAVSWLGGEHLKEMNAYYARTAS